MTGWKLTQRGIRVRLSTVQTSELLVLERLEG